MSVSIGDEGASGLKETALKLRPVSEMKHPNHSEEDRFDFVKARPLPIQLECLLYLVLPILAELRFTVGRHTFSQTP